MNNAIIVDILCGYYDFEYYRHLAEQSEFACLQVMKAGGYYAFLTTEEAVKKQYNRSWKLKEELKERDMNKLSNESLELLADLILEDLYED